MEFSKTIFQAWKVMENRQGHEKSWTVVENDDDVLEFFCKNALEFLLGRATGNIFVLVSIHKSFIFF